MSQRAVSVPRLAPMRERFEFPIQPITTNGLRRAAIKMLNWVRWGQRGVSFIQDYLDSTPCQAHWRKTFSRPARTEIWCSCISQSFRRWTSIADLVMACVEPLGKSKLRQTKLVKMLIVFIPLDTIRKSSGGSCSDNQSFRSIFRMSTDRPLYTPRPGSTFPRPLLTFSADLMLTQTSGVTSAAPRPWWPPSTPARRPSASSPWIPGSGWMLWTNRSGGWRMLSELRFSNVTRTSGSTFNSS